MPLLFVFFLLAEVIFFFFFLFKVTHGEKTNIGTLGDKEAKIRTNNRVGAFNLFIDCEQCHFLNW